MARRLRNWSPSSGTALAPLTHYPNQGTQSLFPNTIKFQWNLDCLFVGRENADQERRRPPVWWVIRTMENTAPVWMRLIIPITGSHSRALIQVKMHNPTSAAQDSKAAIER